MLAARIDGFSAMNGDLAYALAAEKLLGLKPPPRAQQLRVIYGELQRVASHLFWLGRSVRNMTDTAFAVPAYVWEARTAILDLFQWLGGNPITPDVIAIGGLSRDAPDTLTVRLSPVLDQVGTLLDDLDPLIGENQTLGAQLENVGIIDPGTALGLGVTGPSLRACGIAYDVRTAFPYAGYASLEVRVPTERDGDARSRYQVRVGEMRVSVDLIRAVLARLAEGPVNALRSEGLAPGCELPALPSGTTYASVEAPRGELGLCLVSDGSARPQHVHIRAPSFANLSALPFMVRGARIDQVGVVLDSLDISPGEVER
jgi:NADH-quinone oxidoreductase subunit D